MADRPETIHVPYGPENVIDEWGWLWLPTSQGEEWVICRTIEDDDGELIVETWDCGATADVHACQPASDLAGTPYLPLSTPACEPGAGLLVTIRLPGGGSLSYSHDPGPDADRVRDAVIGALALGRSADEQDTPAHG